MPLSEMTQADLEAYEPRFTPPPGLRGFWDRTLAAARALPLDLDLTETPTHLTTLSHWDVSFAGYGGDRIRAWLVRPAGADGPLPVVVEFVGYGGGRGVPEERLTWASAGYAHLVVDTRGQGSVWGGGGHTPDPHGSGPATPGFTTRGILDPEEHYYRRVYTDAARAVEAARALPGVLPHAVAVAGASQGGAIALAAGSLVPDVLAVLPDVPFMSHVRRAVEVCGLDPYLEITRYLSVHRDQAERALNTLDHFDVAHLAPWASAPALFSVALMDRVCPPSTVYAAHRAYGGPAELAVYPFNDHEGGQVHHWRRQLEWLGERVRQVGDAIG
ncbi:acetylxylan esterase [Kineococcus auxinigenes]|uniref:acetylxylan esterase n=1 Tax=unclassified Kineococcus TaxID=2621656 RepID=UPI003D7C6073